MWHETTTTLLFSETHRTSDKTRPSDEKKPGVESWLLSHFLLAMLHIHTPCEWWSLWPTLQRCCVWWVLLGAALFCLLTALLPVLGLADAEVSPRWLIVYGHLSAWPPVCHVATCCRDLGLLGGSRNLEGGGWRGEGRGGSRELRRLQPCLSEQQCCRVEHGSQLARAWRGSGFGYRCLPFTALLWAGEEE